MNAELQKAVNTGLRSRQRGLTLWGWLFVLGVFAFVVFAGIKSFQKYVEYFDVNAVMEWAASQPELYKASPREIRSRIQRRIDTGYVKAVRSTDIKVRRIKGAGDQRELHVEWEVREHFFFNIDVVYSFSVTTPLRGRPPT